MSELAPNGFKKGKEALQWMELVDDPEHPEYDVLTGDLFLEEDPDRAKEFYERAVERRPDNWDYKGKLGIATRNQELMKQALAHGSPTVQARLARNVIEKWYDRRAEQVEAIQFLSAAATQGGDAESRFLYGLFLADGGDVSGATRQWVCDADHDDMENGVGFVPIPGFGDAFVDFCPFGQFTFAFLKSARSELDTERWEWLAEAAWWISDYLLTDKALEAVLWKQVFLNPAFDGIHEFASSMPILIQTVATHSRDKRLAYGLYACLGPNDDAYGQAAQDIKRILKDSFSDLEVVTQSPEDWFNYKPIVVKL
jgi:tetratricopeptide (TPR) repeat protein